MSVCVAPLLNCEQSVIPNRFAVLLRLLTFYQANQSALEQNARIRRLVHEDKNVERITIFGFGARHETEVIGK